MDQTNWMEVIVMAIFVISICNGYRKGFFRLCVSFVATIFTVILVSILTPHVGEAIMKWTSVDEVIEKNCMEIFCTGGDCRKGRGFPSRADSDDRTGRTSRIFQADPFGKQ